MKKIGQIKFYGDGNTDNYPAGLTTTILTNQDGIFNNYVNLLDIKIEAPFRTKFNIIKQRFDNNTTEEIDPLIETFMISALGKYELTHNINACNLKFMGSNFAPLFITFTYEEIDEEKENEKDL